MGKKSLSHNIDGKIKEEFEKLAEKLPGKKYEVLEAALLAFIHLPDELQDRLVSKRPKIQEETLNFLDDILLIIEPLQKDKSLGELTSGFQRSLENIKYGIQYKLLSQEESQEMHKLIKLLKDGTTITRQKKSKGA